MARKKLAPPTRRRRAGRGARSVNLGWWGTISVIALVGILGVVVSRGETSSADVEHALTVPDIAGAQEISVTKVEVEPYERVEEGDTIFEVKAGDETRTVKAPVDGIVAALAAAPDQMVEAGAEIGMIQTGPKIGDHWHTAYGVYVCDRGWLPPVGEFASDYHTHGDGLVHAHGRSNSAAGTNATLGLFFDRAGMELTPTRVEYAGGDTFESGDVECGEGEDKKEGVLRWAINGEEQKGNPANAVVGNGDVFAIAFQPEDEDLETLPPSASGLADHGTTPRHPDLQAPEATTPTPAPAEGAPGETPTTSPTATTTAGG